VLTSATRSQNVTKNESLIAEIMPAFDPVRDAVLNSPIDSPSRSPSFGRRATDLSVLLNDDDDVPHHFPIHRPTPSIHSLLADDALATAEPLRRASTSTLSTPEQRPRSSTPMTQAIPKPLPLAYNPKRRTAPDEVLIPLSPDEIQLYRNYRGQGVKRLIAKRKRAPSDEPDTANPRHAKRHTGDVGVVVQHCENIASWF
jgi:mRNA (guanine-N7-)-methyltransferase